MLASLHKEKVNPQVLVFSLPKTNLQVCINVSSSQKTLFICFLHVTKNWGHVGFAHYFICALGTEPGTDNHTLLNEWLIKSI